MKILVHQNGYGLFTVNNNQFINVGKGEVEGSEIYSIGIENIGFAMYKREKKALAVFKELIKFLGSQSETIFYFPKDN